MVIAVPIQKEVTSNQSLDDTLRYLTQYEKQLKENFPDLHSLTSTGTNTYLWRFKPFEGAGIQFTVEFTTHFEVGLSGIRIISQPPLGTAKLEGGWELKTIDKKTLIQLSATLTGEVPIPFLLKAVAGPVIQSEITKRFDTYLKNVEKALS